MDWLKHAGETRWAFEWLSEDGKKNHAKLWRGDVLKLLEPMVGKVGRQLSGEAMRACKGKGIGMEWNLADNDDAVVFCLTALAGDLTEHENAAVNLLRGCIQIEETGIAPSWFFDVMAGIDLDRKTGKAFKQGRKQGAVGPVRKFIRAALKKNSEIKNEELWQAITKKPPNGWTPMESPRLGRYIEAPAKGKNVEWKSFCTYAAEERKRLKSTISEGLKAT